MQNGTILYTATSKGVRGDFMKKFIASILLTAAVMLFSPILVLANSGPVYWKGYPSSDIMLIEENSPIAVKNENLVFDFSDDIDSGHTINGKATATYKMVNPMNNPQSVQMAFPFVGRLNELLPEDITITADGNVVPYDIYIGDVVDSYGASVEEKEVSFDFNSIVNTITNEPYKAENFTKNEKGKLYTIDVKPTTDQRINFAVDFNFDFNKTKVLTHGFNRYERNGKTTRIAAWCNKPEVLEIYVLGEDIDLNINAYTDGELSKKTDLFTHQISTKEVELKPYLIEYVKNDNYRKINDVFSNTQLYNLYAKALDKYFTQNTGYCSEHDLLELGNYQRCLTLVYTVEFPGNSEKEVSVSYRTSGTMDRRETTDPLYTFDYILNPAKNWKDFKNLYIEIIPPQKAPHIVKSSTQFTKRENNIYTATLVELPEDDLSFTLYAHEKITLLDKTQGKLQRSFGYFVLRAIDAIAFLIIGIIIVMLVLRRKKNKYI
jgi:hypothetical protein